ncbi:MAG: universal stress protein [Bacteroidetes bacterium]|nr:universal stress protein [Bacteroidota bacterium]
MNKIVVPVDFSDTSENAAIFAANLTKQVADASIILYNAFDNIEAGSDGTPLQSDDKGRQALIEFALQALKKKLQYITDADISIQVEENDHFVDSLERFANQNNVQLIVMGITGASKASQILMGSNTLDLVERKTAPVLIVPPDAQFKDTKNIMMICDFKDVEKTIPITALKEVLNLFRLKLYVVNVDSEHYIDLSDEYKAERAKLDSMIKEYEPEYAFIRMYDFVDSINQFASDKNIELIITFPKSHSFLSNIFKTSHTKKLVYHSHVPIVAIHSSPN